jgi:mannose-6-phosphate isomerase-like protein (cupin superfamily)
LTYPPPLYLRSEGEASAWVRRAATTAEVTYANGNTVHYLATGSATDGQFGLYRWVMGPEPSGPGPHFHRTMSESFFIIYGEIRIFDGNEWVDTGSGDFIHVPPGGIHGFRNESGEPASLLIHFAPGAPREAYFEGLADLGAKSPEELSAFYELHDNLWVESRDSVT